MAVYEYRGIHRGTRSAAYARSRSGAPVDERIPASPEGRQLKSAGRPWRRARRHLATVLALVAFAAVGVGCSPQPPTHPPNGSATPDPIIMNGCEAVAPRVLPSGARPGDPTPAGDGRIAWGIGKDRIVEAVGQMPFGPLEGFNVPPASDQWVEIRGVRALVLPIGDAPFGEIVITWQSGRCGYTLWLSRGQTLDEAIRYAAAF